MWHIVRASAAAVMVVLPFTARDIVQSGPWRWTIMGACAFIAFAVTAWDLKPDKRIEKVRKANLDEKLESLLTGIEARVGDNQRLPFRVNLMVRRWCCGIPFLVMVYQYGMRSTDADYGIKFCWGFGQCWKVVNSGQAAFWRCDGKLADDGIGVIMTRGMEARTRHVKAILSLPVRTAHGRNGEPQPKVRGVLNIDALSVQAAQDLQDYWDQIKATGTHNYLDLAEFAGLYC